MTCVYDFTTCNYVCIYIYIYIYIYIFNIWLWMDIYIYRYMLINVLFLYYMICIWCFIYVYIVFICIHMMLMYTLMHISTHVQTHDTNVCIHMYVETFFLLAMLLEQSCFLFMDLLWFNQPNIVTSWLAMAHSLKSYVTAVLDESWFGSLRCSFLLP